MFDQLNVSISPQLLIFINEIGKAFDHQKFIDYKNTYKLKIEEACSKLTKYHWAITDNMEMSFINDIIVADSELEMSKAFESYFFSNNYDYLDHHFNLVWSKSRIISTDRLKIINDCIYLLKKELINDKFNVHNVIVPPLINQIEGLRQDYLLELGYVRKGIKWQDKFEKCVKWKDIYLSLKVDDLILQSLNFFINILFQDDESIIINNFSRHKISHGVNTQYGTLETTLRCFVMIDFFASLE
jgi:hypothetical protein